MTGGHLGHRAGALILARPRPDLLQQLPESWRVCVCLPPTMRRGADHNGGLGRQAAPQDGQPSGAAIPDRHQQPRGGSWADRFHFHHVPPCAARPLLRGGRWARWRRGSRGARGSRGSCGGAGRRTTGRCATPPTTRRVAGSTARTVCRSQPLPFPVPIGPRPVTRGCWERSSSVVSWTTRTTALPAKPARVCCPCGPSSAATGTSGLSRKRYHALTALPVWCGLGSAAAGVRAISCAACTARRVRRRSRRCACPHVVSAQCAASNTAAGFMPPCYPTGKCGEEPGLEPGDDWPSPLAGFSPLCENRLVGTLHLAPCQSNAMWRFRGTSFPRGKAVTYLGRGAMRLNGSLCGNAAPCCR
jgi:hypothetical protein